MARKCSEQPGSSTLSAESSPKKSAWSVHDGQFFSEAVFQNNPRAPQEREFLNTAGYHDIFPPDAQGKRHIDGKLVIGFVSVQHARKMRKNEFVLSKPGKVGKRTVAAAQLQQPTSLSSLRRTMDARATRRWQEFTFSKNVLGRGQFSLVRKAIDPGNGSTVAIKVTHAPVTHSNAEALGDYASLNHSASQSEEDDDNIECFMREVSLLSDLKHPSIVACHGHGLVQTEGGRSFGFVVLDHIEGADMRRHLKPGLSMAKVLRWSMQLCRVLQHLHEHRIIHRDVKASNVMITASGDAMLIDFGLALSFEPSASSAPPEELLTEYQSSRRVGVFGYMAPEVYKCEPYGTAVDIFAFGNVLQLLLKAALPLSCVAGMTSSVRQTMWDSFSCGYERLMCRPLVSPRAEKTLSALLRACMAVDPKQRPKAAAVERMLETTAEALQIAIP